MLTIAPLYVFFAALLLCVGGAVGSLLLRKNDVAANVWANVCVMGASACGLYASMSVLLQGAAFSYTLASYLPLLSLSIHIDCLAAFFIMLISLIALPVSIYALGYVKHYYRRYDIGTLGFFYTLFLASMFLVVSADQALFFLVVWELMSLASYFLVIFEHKEAENVRAGSLYFIMTHVGTAAIALAFLLLYRSTGTLAFAGIREHLSAVSPLVKQAVFVLFLTGFGTKAGIIPLHIWLPQAHPAAPSHVSALMSGVMIKTGIYMFIRMFCDVLAPAPLWWGSLIVLLGALSSLLGVLYALTEHDIKKLLAYHSIENIGIILMGFGSSLMFWSLSLKPLAVMALGAALFHTLNHAVFKALLFLGSGSVIAQTHTRDMEEYGGLLRAMPYTAFFFLVGALAISALPPLNGFFSEWLTFQSLFSGIMASGVSLRWIFVAAAGALAFTGGLAAMCFVKAFGITFLARPRSESAAHAAESGFALQAGMGVLALCTLLIGLGAGSVMRLILGVVDDLQIFRAAEPALSATAVQLQLTNGFASVSGPLLFLVLLAAAAVTALGVSALSGKRKVSRGCTWDCGTSLSPRMEITATAFSRSIITMFRRVLKPTKRVDIVRLDAALKYDQVTHSVELGVRDIYQQYLYRPLQAIVGTAAAQVRRLQNGNTNAYVLYTFLVLLISLFLLSYPL
jgi:hydrogenase-4 component B